RNRLGGLILLPNGTNQSFKDMYVSQKVKHYLKENILAQSFSPEAYKNNPNFTKAIKALDLPFKAFESQEVENAETFTKDHIDQRQQLYFRICNRIWGDFWKVDKKEAELIVA